MNDQVLEDLTLLLLHLTSWREKVCERVYVPRSWKGYDFDVLEALRRRGYIRFSRRSKSILITDEGRERAEVLERLLLPRIRAALEIISDKDQI